MTRLHSSYSNLGSWRVVREAADGCHSAVFDPSRNLMTSAILLVLCLGGAWMLSMLEPAASGMRIAIGLLIATGIVVPAGLAAHAYIEIKKGALMRFYPDKNLLLLPRMGKSIEQARERVRFSSEHYSGQSDHFFEFNVVVDGERLKFLSSSVANAFTKMSEGVERMGFSVAIHRIRMN